MSANVTKYFRNKTHTCPRKMAEHCLKLGLIERGAVGVNICSVLHAIHTNTTWKQIIRWQLYNFQYIPLWCNGDYIFLEWQVVDADL